MTWISPNFVVIHSAVDPVTKTINMILINPSGSVLLNEPEGSDVDIYARIYACKQYILWINLPGGYTWEISACILFCSLSARLDIYVL